MIRKTRKNWLSVVSKMREMVTPNASAMTKEAMSPLITSKTPFNISLIDKKERNVESSQLDNGITVVTEQSSIPSTVTLGISMSIGTKNETRATSGALHSIKTTYYKSHFNSNETINYGMVQMSGGRYDFNYGRERSLFKVSCLSHDVVDLFSMAVDCAIEPRTFLTANVAIEKLGHSHKLEKIRGSRHIRDDFVLSSIFPNSGLDNPYFGREDNIINLDAHTLQKFQAEQIDPSKMIVVGVGVENHGEFRGLVEEFMGSLRKGSNKKEDINKPLFREIETRILNQSNRTKMILLFEGCPLNHKDLVKTHLLKEIIGGCNIDSASLGFGLIGEDLYGNNSGLFSGEAFGLHYEDSGVFGISIITEGNSFNGIADQMIAGLSNLKNIDKVRFESAKKRLKLKYLNCLSNDYSRIEEFVSQQAVLGKFDANKTFSEIDQISVDSFKNFLQRQLSAKKSMILESRNVETDLSLEKVKSILK